MFEIDLKMPMDFLLYRGPRDMSREQYKKKEPQMKTGSTLGWLNMLRFYLKWKRHVLGLATFNLWHDCGGCIGVLVKRARKRTELERCFNFNLLFFVWLWYFRWLGRKETGTENPNYSLNTLLLTISNCFGTELVSTLVV